MTWADVFACIALDLLEHPNDLLVNSRIAETVAKNIGLKKQTVRVEHACYQSIKVQLLALNLVTVAYTKTVKGGMGLFWALTPRGKKLLFELRTTKAGAANEHAENQSS